MNNIYNVIETIDEDITYDDLKNIINEKLFRVIMLLEITSNNLL